MRVYRARDKYGRFWSSSNGRTIFITKGALKFAYYTGRWRMSTKFDEQDEYKIVEYELVEIDMYKEFIKAFELYKELEYEGRL